ncbi:hypothetical protein SPRG_04767 [Saprolegnia parasitica CBS 223.65]|uniref:Uncharacterized protein n=1 Tax=Saprolegnia parasitica (strain CBS 223.65) TaxID=695850 RepID=A0A067CNQ0_SAPPC|nr:hypothetical protein SPRG_04767 [Saprolegnia parasitica CBS 223.65]KDO30865.1 hypothetical protein SPRG_04767 [Saprolegnia parasitica CBS 223.65]|eukprot:XP_012198560.1 hypothetical protein SPRG_04767 [Saprolegnia parasitica CBS 223.65]
MWLDALDIDSLGGNHVAHLILLLYMPHMKSLAISNVEYVHLGGALLSKLPQLTALEHLRLERTRLDETNCALSTTSCLRSVHLDSVDLSTQSFEAVLLFALGSDHLEAVTWKRCSIIGASVDCVADTVLHCITEQVPKIAMKACGIRAPSLHALAERFCMLKADVPTEINLARNALTLVSTRALVEAVVTCQKVTIVLSKSALMGVY